MGTSKKRGKAMACYPKELAQDAAYQNHTRRLTELWSLPRPAQGLNTNNNNNNNNNNVGCTEFFVKNFNTFVSSKLRTKLLATNNLIT